MRVAIQLRDVVTLAQTLHQAFLLPAFELILIDAGWIARIGTTRQYPAQTASVRRRQARGFDEFLDTLLAQQARRHDGNRRARRFRRTVERRGGNKGVST